MHETREEDDAKKRAKTVDRVHVADLTPRDFYHTYKRCGVAVVLQGFLDGVEDWDLPYLSSQLGDRSFTIRCYGEGHFDRPRREWSQYCEHRPMSFDVYAEMLRTHEAHHHRAYLAQMPIGETPLVHSVAAALARVAEFGRFVPITALADWNLWLGPGGHTEPMHFDTGDGTLMQLHGAKIVDLFPVWEMHNVYPFDFYDTLPPWVSRVDFDRLDFNVFPRMRQAMLEYRRVRIDRGDLLYIPVGWWHEVTSEGDDYSCSLNHFWRAQPLRRNFGNRRLALFYFLNKIPWQAVLAMDRGMRRVLGREVAAAKTAGDQPGDR